MEEIKRAVGSRSFALSLLAVCAVLAAGTKFNWSGDLEAETHLKILMDAMKSDVMVFMLPILAVLPYTTAFVDEVHSGFAKFYLLRTRRSAYILGKTVSAWLGAFMALAGGAFLNAFAYWILLSPRQAVAEGAGMWGDFVMQVMRLGAAGGLCALLGTLLAVWMMSNYMAYIAPFVIYYFLIMLKERYFDTLYCIYPKEWMNPEHFWGKGESGLFFFFLIWTLCLGVLCCRVMGRRLWDV